MIPDPANPLNYKRANPIVNAGIDLPKSTYYCKQCRKEYEPWQRQRNKLVFNRYCGDCK